jgi:hypothetical protein
LHIIPFILWKRENLDDRGIQKFNAKSVRRDVFWNGVLISLRNPTENLFVVLSIVKNLQPLQCVCWSPN